MSRRTAPIANAPEHDKSLRAKIILVVFVIVSSSVMAAGWISISTFSRAIEPEIQSRTLLVGSILRSKVQRALELGIPIETVAGLDEYLGETLDNFEEVSRIAIESGSGNTFAQASRASAAQQNVDAFWNDVIRVHQRVFVLPILQRNDVAGRIIVEVSPVYVQSRLRDVFIDVFVLALSATLISLEVILGVITAVVGKPLTRIIRVLQEQKQGIFLHVIRRGGLSGIGRMADRLNDRAIYLTQRIARLEPSERRAFRGKIAEGKPRRLRLSETNDVRLSLFLIAFATEIAASFLPVYARGLPRPDWLNAEFAAAAPILFGLAGLVLVAPFGRRLTDQFGSRALYLYSILPCMIALLAMTAADSLLVVSLLRGVISVAFAVASIAGLNYAIAAAAKRGSAEPKAAYFVVIYAGILCGSSVGGVVAERFGIPAAFGLGSTIAIMAATAGYFAMTGSVGDRPASAAAATPPVGVSRISARIVALFLAISVPMNLSAAIFIWYLTPLMLNALGAGPAVAGRIIMLYYLTSVLLNPLAAKLSDGRLGPLRLMIIGALLSGVALLSLTPWQGYWAIVIAVVILGIGHTFIRLTHYGVAGIISEAGSKTIDDTLRFLERSAVIAGFVIGIVLLNKIGFDAGIMVLGFLVLAGAVGFTLVMAVGRKNREVL